MAAVGAFAIVALPPDDEMTSRQILGTFAADRGPYHGHQRAGCHRDRCARSSADDSWGTQPTCARHRAASRGRSRHGLGKKVRNLVARPRRNSKARRNYTAEGTHWPGLAYEMLQSFLAELGTDDVVDPPALVGERHWPPSVVRNDPEPSKRIGVSCESKILRRSMGRRAFWWIACCAAAARCR